MSDIINKKCKVVMLPTEKSEITDVSQICIMVDYTNNFLIPATGEHILENLLRGIKHCSHLYITSEDRIERGDYFIFENTVERAIKVNDEYVTLEGKYGLSHHREHCSKIIATTDDSLKYVDYDIDPASDLCNLPRPSEAFIEKYCSLNGFDDILVPFGQYYSDIHGEYEHIEMSSESTIVILDDKQSWNREEVEALITKALKHEGYQTEFGQRNDIRNWIAKNI